MCYTCVSIYVCVYANECLCVWVCASVSRNVYVCTYKCICMSVSFVFVYGCVHVGPSACTHTCDNIRIYVHMYVCSVCECVYMCV